MRSGAKLHVAVQMVFLCVFITPREQKKKRNTAHIEFGAGGIFFLNVESRGENFDGDFCPKPERIHEYLTFVYVRELVPTVIKFLKRFFLFIRELFK